VGVEREAPLLAVAGDVIEERGLTNVRLVQGDATATGLPRAAFDLVHERLLLMITPAVGRVLAEMIALARGAHRPRRRGAAPSRNAGHSRPAAPPDPGVADDPTSRTP